MARRGSVRVAFCSGIVPLYQVTLCSTSVDFSKIDFWPLRSAKYPIVRRSVVGWATTIHVGRSRVRFPMTTWSFRQQYGPGVDSASDINEYQEFNYVITHTNTCTYKYILFKKSKIYIKTFKTLLHFSITRPSSGSIYCAVQRESHAAQHTTHNHNQAHSKQLTTHTQNHDMLPQHQS